VARAAQQGCQTAPWPSGEMVNALSLIDFSLTIDNCDNGTFNEFLFYLPLDGIYFNQRTGLLLFFPIK
jgi:hypothetical protein